VSPATEQRPRRQPTEKRRAGSPPNKNRVLNAIPPLVLLALVLGAWEIYVDSGGVDPLVLPAPHEVATAAWDNVGVLASNLRPTAEEIVLGVTLALVGGFALAIAIHLSPLLRRAIYPLAVGSQAVPIAAIAALLIYWWGFGILPKLAVVALICFFPVLVTTVDGLASVDPEQLKLLRTMDATRWQALRYAELPAAVPAAISGARIALTVAVIGAYIAESQTATIGAYPGLGHEINADLTALQTPRAYAAAALLFVLAIACFYTLALLERHLAPWAHRPRGELR
jgi:putative hydroxymethylpyrimidine transport system permease protein